MRARHIQTEKIWDYEERRQKMEKYLFNHSQPLLISFKCDICNCRTQSSWIKVGHLPNLWCTARVKEWKRRFCIHSRTNRFAYTCGTWHRARIWAPVCHLGTGRWRFLRRESRKMPFCDTFLYVHTTINYHYRNSFSILQKWSDWEWKTTRIHSPILARMTRKDGTAWTVVENTMESTKMTKKEIKLFVSWRVMATKRTVNYYLQILSKIFVECLTRCVIVILSVGESCVADSGYAYLAKWWWINGGGAASSSTSASRYE